MDALAPTKRIEVRKRRIGFDDLEVPSRARYYAERVDPSNLSEVLTLAKENIPAVRGREGTPLRILSHDPDAICAIKRNGKLAGLYAYLTLNETGVSDLKNNLLNTGDPPLSRLSPPNVSPAAIYIWAIVGRGLASEMMCHLSLRLRAPHLRTSDIYAVPTTPEGERFILRLGFEWVRCAHPNLVGYRRRHSGGLQIPIAA